MVQVKRFDAPPINRREILRYAGCRQETAEISAMLDVCLTEALPLLTYDVCWAEFALPEEIASDALRKKLSGCRRAIVFGATIGLAIDRMIAKYSRIAPSKAVFMQAIGAERIESLCDAFEDHLRAQGNMLRPRFSPGYGDLPLSAQVEIFSVLECARHIGLSLNGSLLMSPSKSVTAIIGLCNGETDSRQADCDGCGLIHCQFRRNINEHS